MDRNPLYHPPHLPLLPPVVQPGRSRFRRPVQVLNIVEWHALVNRAVTAVTGKECGDSRRGDPASFSRLVTTSRMAVVVRAWPVGFLVRRVVEQNCGRSLTSAAMPATSRSARIYPSGSCRTGI